MEKEKPRIRKYEILLLLCGLAGFAYLFYIIGYNIGENKSSDYECKEDVIRLKQKVDSLTYSPQLIELRERVSKSIINGEALVECQHIWSYSADLKVAGCDSIAVSRSDKFWTASTISATAGTQYFVKLRGGNIYIINVLEIGGGSVKLEVVKYKH
ncbi:hypothetical protein [Viscerimonas tarda]